MRRIELVCCGYYPRRGIGQASVDAITAVAQELGVTFWEILKDETSVNTLAGRPEVDHQVCADDLPLAGAAQHSPASEIVKA